MAEFKYKFEAVMIVSGTFMLLTMYELPVASYFKRHHKDASLLWSTPRNTLNLPHWTSIDITRARTRYTPYIEVVYCILQVFPTNCCSTVVAFGLSNIFNRTFHRKCLIN
ncbi:hypothetical protein QTP88_020382 [Uroleucon formosanum]